MTLYLGDEIRAAEQAGDWALSQKLKAQQLHARPFNSVTGVLGPVPSAPVPPPAEPVVASGDGGARAPLPPPTRAEAIAAAERRGDWDTARRLKSAQLLNRAAASNPSAAAAAAAFEAEQDAQDVMREKHNPFNPTPGGHAA